MIMATELGMMSTSMSQSTPIDYMKGASNVLWELCTRPEDEHGYHQGADVSMVSQFASEREELFPPLTMLRVLPRPPPSEDCSEAGNHSENSEGSVDAQEAGGGKASRRVTFDDDAHLAAFQREWMADVKSIDNREFLHIVVEPTFV